jgi:hypothetical protein
MDAASASAGSPAVLGSTTRVSVRRVNSAALRAVSAYSS